MIFNLYGPTEDTTFSTVCRIPQEVENINNLGEPIDGTNIYLLDNKFQFVPNGVIGEIFLSGSGTARGYLNRPALTAKKFLPNPFSKIRGMRMYATGDLAYRNEQGQLILKGRADEQVKIRGYRIELEEIESVIRSLENVEQVIVIKKEINNENYLVVYYSSQMSINSMVLSTRLANLLPNYMLPAFYIQINEWPLTQSGKIDRNQLTARNDTFVQDEPILLPTEGIEKILVDIWNELLPIKSHSLTQSFFHLGGHSIMALQLISRIRDHLKNRYSY